MKVGFIGLGRMGSGMARSLVRAGADLIVYDASHDALEALARDGAGVAASVTALAREADVIFTSLPGPPQVEEVLVGPQGILSEMRPGQAVFDLSTSSLPLARRIHAAMKAAGGDMLDAPVSGGPQGAASGDLVVWVGGDRAVYDRHLGLLQSFSKPRHVGDIGAGTVTKLCHNMLGYTILLAQAEAFSVAVKAGLDPLDLWEALRLGVVGKQSPLNMLTNQFLPGRYTEPAFLQRLAHKDVSLATAMAKDVGVPMRLANLVMEEMTEALAAGFGEQDSRAYLQLQLRRAGVSIAVEPDRLKDAVARCT